MSRPSSAAVEVSLINGVEFLEELERQDYLTEPPRPVLAPVSHDDAFDALDTDLPQMEPPFVAEQPVRRYPLPAYDDDEPVVAPAISPRAAAIVILLCLSVGAATATVVFHDQVSRISALMTASR